MDTKNSKQNFLNLVERERACTDRTGNDFSFITFNINKFIKNGGEKNDLRDLLKKNIRDYDNVGFLEKNCFTMLFPQTSGEEVRKVAHRFCNAVIPENLNPTSTVFTYPSREDPEKQVAAQHASAETSGTIPHMKAWA
ncbi:MAG: hypothetical protein WCQ99_02760, partial [Pseudomonadota bacterium]